MMMMMMMSLFQDASSFNKSSRNDI